MSILILQVLFAPFVLIAVAAILLRSKPYLRSSIVLSVGLSSWAVIFYCIRIMGSFFGGADIGFGIIMFYSGYVTIPLALLGLALGKFIDPGKAIRISAIALCAWVGLALLYNLSIELEESRYEQKSKIDCEIMPYHCAINEDRISELPTLRAEGHDIDSEDGWGRTALLAHIHDYESVEILLELGANPNILDPNGYSALSLVLSETSKADFEIADLLIRNGVDIDEMYGNNSGSKKMTVLNRAISKKQQDVVGFLMAHGADPMVRDDYGHTGCDRVRIYDFREVEALNDKCPLPTP